MRRRRFSLFVALLAMFAIVAAACGESKTSRSTTAAADASACPAHREGRPGSRSRPLFDVPAAGPVVQRLGSLWPRQAVKGSARPESTRLLPVIPPNRRRTQLAAGPTRTLSSSAWLLWATSSKLRKTPRTQYATSTPRSISNVTSPSSPKQARSRGAAAALKTRAKRSVIVASKTH